MSACDGGVFAVAVKVKNRLTGAANDWGPVLRRPDELASQLAAQTAGQETSKQVTAGNQCSEESDLHGAQARRDAVVFSSLHRNMS